MTKTEQIIKDLEKTLSKEIADPIVKAKLKKTLQRLKNA